jgi:putative transposase
LSVRGSCRLIGLRVATWHYRSQARYTSMPCQCPREIAASRFSYGYERLDILLIWKGWLVGRDKVHRLYTREGFHARMRVRRKKRISLRRRSAPTALASLDTSQPRKGIHFQSA